jgi:Papain family cysteine protease
MKMKKIIFGVLLVCLSSTLFSQQNKFQTGLIFSTQEELEGIPLASLPYSGKELAKFVDLSGKLPTPGNQGKQSSCVAWATGYALKAYQEKIETNQFYNFSPSFIYNQINHGRDGGSDIIEALNLLSQQGVCTKDVMPYNENDYLTKPNDFQNNKAKKYKIDYWRRVNIRDIKEVKAQINAGYPIVFGAVVDEGFTKFKKNDSSKSIWRKPLGKTMGGHAMLAIGYDDDKRAFKIINSWGTEWGEDGYGWIDYTYFSKIVALGFVAKDAINAYDNDEVITDVPVKPDVVNVLPVAPSAPNSNTIKPWIIPVDSLQAIRKPLSKDEINAIKKNVEEDPDMIALKKIIKENPTGYSDALKAFNIKKMKLMPVVFYTSNVKNNDYDSTNKSASIQITGNLMVPPEKGRIFKIVTHFYDANTNLPVGSSIQPKYADLNGFVASGTDDHPISKFDYNNSIAMKEMAFTWTISTPYSAFNIKAGMVVNKKYIPSPVKLYAIPTIYIDGFGVSSGEKIYFTILK